MTLFMNKCYESLDIIEFQAMTCVSVLHHRAEDAARWRSGGAETPLGGAERRGVYAGAVP